MSGPWEKYQTQPAEGPWTKYAKQLPPPKTIKDIFQNSLQRAVANKGEASGFLDETKRVFSSVNEDYLAGALGSPVDAVNWLLGGVGLKSERPVMGTDWLRDQMRDVGASQEGYRPQTTVGKYAAAGLGGAGAGMAGGALMGGGIMAAGQALPGALGAATTAAGRASITPVLDAAAGAGAGIGGQTAEDIAPGSRLAQILGQLGGAMIGGGLAAWPKSTPGPVIEAFDNSNIPPTMGTTGGRSAAWLQNNVLQQSAGAGGVVDDALKASQGGAENTVKMIADQYGQGAPTSYAAGQMVQGNVAGWFDRVTDAAGNVYDDVGRQFGPDELFPVPKTIDALQNPVGKITDPNLADVLSDPVIAKYLEAVRKSNGQFSYDNIKEFRSRVGYLLGPGQRGLTIDEAQLRKLYAGLTDDLSNVVSTRGADTFNRWARANALYSNALDKFRKHFKPLLGAGQDVPAEQAYRMLVGSAGKDFNRFKEIWSVLTPEQRGDYAATILINMGKKNPEAVGEAAGFSVLKFIGDYDSIQPQAKALIFRSTGNSQVESALDDLLTAVKSLEQKADKAIVRGKSGVALPWLAQGSGMVSAAQMIAGGEPTKGIGLLLLSLGGPYAAAKLMTNATATRQLARALAALAKSRTSAIKLLPIFQSFVAPPDGQKEPMRVTVPNPQGTGGGAPSP